MTIPLTTDQANAIWAVLVEYAGAQEHARDEFVESQTGVNAPTEYRFIGSLGFGGKFWNDNGRWHVTCYREDSTPERQVIVAATNDELTALMEAA